ncbi:MAG: 30S ribosomal protein S5 [Candidatus Gracilibacteria bacterium]|jgi:small subunit ribosomal protein S5
MFNKGDQKGKFQKREAKEFDEEVIEIDRVTKVVKGGRKLRFRATVVIGNRKNKVGVGVGKSNEVTGSIQKAINKAKKNMITIPLDGTTIPHQVYIKFKSAKLLLMPASAGTGIIAGGTLRKVLTLAGIKDILSKSFGTTNKVNTTKATIEALKLLRETYWSTKKKNKLAEVKKPEEKSAQPNPNTQGNKKPFVPNQNKFGQKPLLNKAPQQAQAKPQPKEVKKQ